MIFTKLLPFLSFPSFSIILSSSYRVFPVIPLALGTASPLSVTGG